MRLRLTIGKKLNSLIAGLQLVSIGGAVVFATQLFTTDLVGLLRKGTLEQSSMLSSRVKAEMKHVADRARMLGTASLEDFRYAEDRLKFIQDNLAVDAQYIGLALYRAKGQTANFKPQWRIVHPRFLKKLKLKTKDYQAFDKKFPVRATAVAKGSVDFRVGKMKDGTPVIRMALPFVQRKDGTFSQFLVIDLQQERFTSLFAESTAYTSYLLDRNYRVLGSSDPVKIPLDQKLEGSPISAAIGSAKSQSGQTDFIDAQGEEQMGAFHKVGFASLSVVSQVPTARATLAQSKLFRRMFFLAGAFVGLALFLGFMFSQTMTGPIQALAQAATRIKEGDFTFRLKTKQKTSGDEIQEFSSTFNEMVAGLQERDRIKTTFQKFHSKEVAEKLLTGELSLGGERKNATVFFSDVRGFTALSEKLNPETLVKILNRYMTAMVRVILDHGGIVDKYVGDAIMAVWGVPLPKPDDAERAVRACLGMRVALEGFNAELINEGLPPLKIGMGLNYGPLISGNIGSDERMEYTVIGDTVNTASRIETLTKAFGTDLLVGQSVLEQVPDKFVAEKTHEAKVKGKSEALVIYKINGYLDDRGMEVIVETPYSSYQAEKSDKVLSTGNEGPTPPPPPPAARNIAAPIPPPFVKTETTQFTEVQDITLTKLEDPATMENETETVETGSLEISGFILDEDTKDNVA